MFEIHNFTSNYSTMLICYSRIPVWKPYGQKGMIKGRQLFSFEYDIYFECLNLNYRFSKCYLHIYTCYTKALKHVMTLVNCNLCFGCETCTECSQCSFVLPQVSSVWFKLYLYQQIACGPPSLLLVKGTKLRKLPAVFQVHCSLL